MDNLLIFNYTTNGYHDFNDACQGQNTNQSNVSCDDPGSFKRSIVLLLFILLLMFQFCGCDDSSVDEDDPISPPGSTEKKDDPDPPSDSTEKKDETDSNIIEIAQGVEHPTTWENQYVYVVSNSFYVRSTLTIQPGTVVKFQPGEWMNVTDEGVISAKGTLDEPIIFTSSIDDEHGGDTNLDGSVSAPSKGDWNGIELYSVQGSVFDHCQFFYSSSSNDSALYLSNSQAVVSNCVFAHNGGGGGMRDYHGALNAFSARLGTTISNNRFYDNIIPLSINQNFDLDDTNIFQDDSGTVFNTYNAIFFYSSGGNIDRDLRLEETEVAIVFDDYTYWDLMENTTLTIGDNVVLKFMTDAQFEIHDGEKAIINYDGEGVYFTSFRDDSLKGDSNGDGDTTSPTKNSWKGIVDYSSTPSVYFNWPNILYNSNL